MSNEVFANGNEIACKSGDDKVTASFPDVCLSPPSPPAGPIPVPYPDTSFSKDMQNGSKTVKIDGKEVMLKDQSFYKTSPLGDEAATNSLGAGVITHVITGKTYFVAWSMDVKFEGENVDRHLDLTTSNHASPMANEQLPLPGLESMIMTPAEKEEKCKKLHDEKDEICAQIQKVQIPKDPAKWLGKIGTKRKPIGQLHELCDQINKRIKSIEDCLAARQRVTDECFDGVTDPRHQDVEDKLRVGLAEANQAHQDFCIGPRLPGF
ncbi:MAG: DUF4150 domain-containing protein [Methyloglobulus sp.]|nr:DUF4150 domain-containing protein [Methyloglobulus sp.]